MFALTLDEERILSKVGGPLGEPWGPRVTSAVDIPSESGDRLHR
jgi:hypothetical protein